MNYFGSFRTVRLALCLGLTGVWHEVFIAPIIKDMSKEDIDKGEDIGIATIPNKNMIRWGRIEDIKKIGIEIGM
jgi:hypothetical protein